MRGPSRAARLVLALGYCVTVWAALGNAQTRAGASVDTTTSLLRPGDLVRVTVWRKPEYSGEFAVSAEGTLVHPFYQGVRVTGMPIRSVKDSLTSYLARFEQNPLLTVEPLFRVTVGGEVRVPNVYPLTRSTTVAQAIALAGGPTERGRLQKVRLYRAGQRMALNLTDPRSDQANLPIASGDYIVVGRGGSIFRDVILPMASLTAAVVSVVVAIRQ